MSGFQYYLIHPPQIQEWAMSIARPARSMARLLETAIPLHPSSERFLYIGGEAAIEAGLDPEYRPAQPLCDPDGQVVAIALLNFSTPDAALLPHSICYDAASLGSMKLMVLFSPSPGISMAGHAAIPFPIREGSRLAITRAHHPRQPVGPSATWWQERLGDPTASTVRDHIHSALPDLSGGFDQWITDDWADANKIGRFKCMVYGLEDSLVLARQHMAFDDAEPTLRTSSFDWPWGSFPCTDHPECFGEYLHERSMDRLIYAVTDRQLQVLRDLMMPCGRQPRGRFRRSTAELGLLYAGLASRVFLTGSFWLGQVELGSVQARNGLTRDSCLRSSWPPFDGDRFPVVATLWKERDHCGARNPEEQKGIGLIKLSTDQEGL